MYENRPSSPLLPPLLASVHPPESKSQPVGPPLGGASPPAPPPLDHSVPPGTALEIAAVQHRLADTNRPIREPFALSTVFRHSGWERNRLLVYHSLRRTGQPQSRISSFTDCGAEAYVLQSTENPTVYKIAGSSCHDRFCLPCASDRARGIAANVLEFLSDRTIRFLTLTLKHSTDPLATQLDKLYESFQALRRRRFWTKHVRGGIAFLELTYKSDAGTWHPHFHILIEGTYLAHPELKRLWHEITGDSFIVDIRPVRNNDVAARYVTKYASKPFNNTFLNRPGPLDEAVVALKGRKLLFTFGTWRGLTVVQKPTEDGWHHLGPLEDIIRRAARGDQDATTVLATLTDIDLAPLFARAPPLPAYTAPPAPPLKQLTFFGVWTNCGEYV